MSINIKSIAQKATTLCKLMEGREKGETADLIESDKIYTVDGAEYCTISNENGSESVWVYTLKEEKKKFYFAGHVLKNIFNAILQECEGDYEEVSKLVEEQGFQVLFDEQKTRDGRRTYTTVTVY